VANFILQIEADDNKAWNDLLLGPYESTAAALKGLSESDLYGRIRVIRVTADKSVVSVRKTNVTDYTPTVE